MENGSRGMTRQDALAILLTFALLVGSAGIARGQQAPPPAPAPPAAPEPAEPPEPPEPPQPPEPPEAAEAPEVFLLNDGTAHLGVSLSDVSREKAQELKLPAVAGAIVNSVQKDSPAAKAGIEKGDAIMEFDGIRVRSSAELRRLIRETPAGRTVEMKVVRDGKPRVLSAKLEATTQHYNFNFNMPEIHIPPMNFSVPPLVFGPHRATLGISGDDLSPQLAQYFGAKQGKGVLISEVTKGSAADKAGLKAGDVIVQVDGKPIGNVEELRNALNDNFTGDTRKVSLTIVRDRREQNVNADLTRGPSWEKHTSSAAGQGYDQAMAQLRSQLDQLRAQAERERSVVQAKVAKQKQLLQGEWQRQLREQMLALKDQLKEMQNYHIALRKDGEI